MLIFQNEDILIGNKPVFFKTWYTKGIIYLNDLIQDDCNFYGEHEFTTLYNIHTNFIQYNGILMAINKFLTINDITAFNNKYTRGVHPVLKHF